MAKFMFLFRGGHAPMAELSPELVQAHMAKWQKYMGNLAQNGKLNGGLPLQPGGKTVGQQGAMVTDGPFAEGKEIVGGYLMITATDLDEAVAISKECPVLDFDGSTIEVRELAEIPS